MVYVLSQDGKLYLLSDQRKMVKWMDIKVTSAYAMRIEGTLIICGCGDSIVRCFDSESLKHIFTLPKTPPLGKCNQFIGEKTNVTYNKEDCAYSDAVAIALDSEREKLIVVYSDRMTLIWDLKEKEKIQIQRSFLSHRDPVTDLAELPDSS